VTPNVKLIYLTMNKDCDLALEALQVGASAYLLKNSRSAELMQAIENVTRGLSYITPEISAAIKSRTERDPNTAKKPVQLTDRQREVLQLIAEGHCLKEIAFNLGISHRTVRFHKYRIMELLEIKSDAELVQYAIRHNITALMT
jgi:DNA-binding NarL/FixJ family response regulator